MGRRSDLTEVDRDLLHVRAVSRLLGVKTYSANHATDCEARHAPTCKEHAHIDCRCLDDNANGNDDACQLHEADTAQSVAY